MSRALTYAVNSGKWTIVGNIATIIGGFLFAGLAIRYLGIERAGFSALVATFSAFSGGIGGLGLGTATVYELSAALREGDTLYASKVFRTSCVVCALVSGFFGTALILGWKLICDWGGYSVQDTESHVFCVLSSVAFVFWQLNGVQRCAMRAAQAFDLIAALTWIQGFGVGLFTTVLLALKSSLVSVGAVQLTASALALLFGDYMLKKRVGLRLGVTVDGIFLRRAWRFGSGAYATTMFGLLADGADKVLLAKLGGVSALPAYNFARKIYQQVHGLLNDQCAYLFPLFAGSNDRGAQTSAYQKMQWLVASASSIFFGGLLFIGPQIGSLVVGDSFGRALILPIDVFSTVGFVHSLTNVPFFISYAQGRSWPNFWLNFSCGALSLVLMVLIGVLCDVNLATLGQLGIIPGVLFYLVIWRGMKNIITDLFATMLPAAPAIVVFSAGCLVAELLPRGSFSLYLSVFCCAAYAVSGMSIILASELYSGDCHGRLYVCAKALDIFIGRSIVERAHLRVFRGRLNS